MRSRYVQPRREATVTARLTAGDRRLVEAAAAARSATVSAYVADAVTRAARCELLTAAAAEREELAEEAGTPYGTSR
jgi:uncharacterized protein (DUF1778 family)